MQSLEVGKVQPGRRAVSGVASALCQQSLESLTYKCSSVGGITSVCVAGITDLSLAPRPSCNSH